MYDYSVSQWLLFFYIYCFIGWVWESCYVSFNQKKWVNRGFLHGPFLPIYGSGAIVILLSTIPVSDNYILIFIFGMIGATVLEYFTGVLMEKMFKVRYWDYSDEKFNLNGHICLKCSIAWGFFSILMIKLIHSPVKYLVFLLPRQISEVLALAFSFGIAIDTTISFREAMDLREVITNLVKSSEEIKNIQKRVNMLMETFDENKYKLKEATSKLEERLQDESIKYQTIIKDKKDSAYKALEGAMENSRKKKDDMIKSIHTSISEYLSKIGNEKTEDVKLRNELEEYKEKLKFHSKLNGVMRKNKIYKSSMKILKRNPSAVSKKINIEDKR